MSAAGPHHIRAARILRKLHHPIDRTVEHAPEREQRMPITVSVDAARRQSFGKRFETTPHDERIANELLHGVLNLRPHREWDLPEVPNWNENPFTDRNWVAQFHMLRWMDPLRRVAEKGN